MAIGLKYIPFHDFVESSDPSLNPKKGGGKPKDQRQCVKKGRPGIFRPKTMPGLLIDYLDNQAMR